MTDAPLHISVMPDEVAAALELHEGAVVVDCTLGLGGHSMMIASRIGAKWHLVGIDQDAAAIELARARLADFKGRLDIVKSNFGKLGEVLEGLGVGQVDGVLFDLGVSSLQLDAPERGFSFRSDGPLDMRMDPQGERTAEDLVNELPEEELADIIFHFGEERFSRRIASRIVEARSGGRIRGTAALADIVLRSLPRGYQRERLHPATRTFQALRIALNRELEVLEEALDHVFDHVKVGGRVAVISFHSLEDRIVKEKFRTLAREGRARLLTKKPLRPTEAEASVNPRSRSAKFRAIERIA
jgi:16S rRNA (cytosine1402-N4)-methyltransferase